MRCKENVARIHKWYSVSFFSANQLQISFFSRRVPTSTQIICQFYEAVFCKPGRNSFQQFYFSAVANFPENRWSAKEIIFFYLLRRAKAIQEWESERDRENRKRLASNRFMTSSEKCVRGILHKCGLRKLLQLQTLNSDCDPQDRGQKNLTNTLNLWGVSLI